MSSTAINFFKCLICHSYFGDLLKAQKHVDKEQLDKKDRGNSCRTPEKTGMDNVPIRRRGMLPIEKVTFIDCFVPLVKVPTNSQTLNVQMRACRKASANYATKGTVDEVIAQKKEGQIICPLPTCNSTHQRYFALTHHLRKHTHAERKELVRNSDHHPNQKPVNFPQTFPMNPKILECKFCLRKEPSLQELNSHQDKVHSDQRKLQCPHCSEEGFGLSVIAFIGHMKTCHPNKLDPNKERFEKPNRSKKFKCDHCQYSSTKRGDLNRHVERAHPKGKQNVTGNSSKQKLSCPVCGRECCSQVNLRRHFHLHLENNPFTCDFPNCNRKFTSHYNLRKHKLKHDEAHVKASQQKCTICGAAYVRKETLDRHVRVFHDPSNLKAGSFNLPQMRRSIFQTSNISQTVEEVNPAMTAPDNSDSVPLLESKVKYEPDWQSTKHGSIKMEEDIAGEEVHLVDRILLDEDGTALHVKGEQLTPQQATTMTMSTETSSNIINVAANESEEMPKSAGKYSPYGVIATDPAFKKIAKLDPTAYKLFSVKHDMNRSGIHFSCNECHGVFHRAWTLQLHMKTQNKKTLVGEFLVNNDDTQGQSVILMCALCAYPAQSKEDLATHMKSHNNSFRIFKCKTKGCGQVFGSLSKLTAHMNGTHPGGRQDVSCNFCDNTFNNRFHRRRHEFRVHWRKGTGDKRKCPVCNVAITPKRCFEHMNKHEDEEAGVEKHKCRLCHDSFSGRMALQRHIDCVPWNMIYYGKVKKKKAAHALGEKMGKGEIVDRRTMPGDNYSRGHAAKGELETEAILGP